MPSEQLFEFEVNGESADSISGGDSFSVDDLAPGTYDVTEVVPAGWDLASITCGEQDTSPVSNGISIELAGGDEVVCDFTNSTAIVCAEKSVGQTASDQFQADDFPFSMQSGMASVEALMEESECRGTSFRITPGAQFQLTETISEADAPFVGFVSGQCSSGQNEPVQIIDGVITTTAPVDGGEVYCQFVNDSIRICVTKQFGQGATELEADRQDFDFRLGDGAAQTPGDTPCNEIPTVEFLVAPGTPVTISEVLPSDSPIRPTSITCEQFLPREEDVVAVGTANLTAGSISFSTSAENINQINCTFTNDALIVCVTKTLNDAANDIADPGDFTFELMVAGEETLELVPTEFDPLCGETEGSAMGVVGAAIPPGTTFSLGEQDPGPTIGLTSASCQAGNDQFELEDDSTSRTIDNISPGVGVTFIDCEFNNQSTLVCVTKEFGGRAREFGLTLLPDFTVIADGETVEPDENLCEDRAATFGFYVAPGSSVEITEMLPDASPVGLTSASCFSLVDGRLGGTVDESFEDNTVSFDVNPGLGLIDCALTNDAAVVCVRKSVDLFLFRATGIRASDFGFTLTVDGSEVPSSDDQVCTQLNGDTDAFTGFLVPPGSTFTVTEDLSTSAAGLVSAECNSFPSNAIGDIATRSVTFTLLGSQRAGCDFRNDAIPVCVLKQLGPNALSAGFSSADFGFDLQVDSGGLETFEGDLCVSGDPELSADSGFGFLMQPNVGFTITETSTLPSSAPIALVDVQCVADNQIVESTIDLAAGTVMIAGDHNATFIECTVTNETAIVCVAKRLNFGAIAAGYTALRI